jgi:polar amino acid transport system substrate-binding protein
LYFLYLFVFGAHAQEIRIRVVTEDTFPIQFIQDGEVKGPATELVKSVLAEANILYTIDVLPWARAYNNVLTQPNTIIYSIARTKHRESLFQWIGSVMKLDYYLVGMDHLKLKQPITLGDLKKLRIGAIRDSATEQYLISLGFKNLYTVNKHSQSIKMLKLGRIDLFPTNYSSFQFSCLHLKVNCQKIKALYQLDQLTASLYFALSHQTNSELVDKVNAAYNKVMSKQKNNIQH